MREAIQILTDQGAVVVDLASFEPFGDGLLMTTGLP